MVKSYTHVSFLGLLILLTLLFVIKLESIAQSCIQKSKGDANCDNIITIVDFEIWRREFLGELPTKTADFDTDGSNKPDIIDYEIWRREFTSPTTTLTPTSSLGGIKPKLPWGSGLISKDAGEVGPSKYVTPWEQYFGRNTGAVHIQAHFIPNFNELARYGSTTSPYPTWQTWRSYGGKLLMGMPMWPNAYLDSNSSSGDAKSLACAAGNHNAYWEAFAKTAADNGRTAQNTSLLLAWEVDGSIWRGDHAGRPGWIQCWRNIYTSIKKHSTMNVAWVFVAGYLGPLGDPWNNFYPGDAYVDHIGVDIYDYKVYNTNQRWDCTSRVSYCFAAAEARRRGKNFVVPEWGLINGDSGPSGPGGYSDGNRDNPVFIQRMYDFYNSNKDIMFGEAYFQADADKTVGPNYLFEPPNRVDVPNASAKYKELFGNGNTTY